VYIAEEIEDTAGNQFKIAGGYSGLKVSWQVTGIRQDPWANANRPVVEEDKPEKEVGTYLYPEGYGYGAEKNPESVRNPEAMEERLKIKDQKPEQAKAPVL
jgi:hypothetical protein